VVGIDLGERRIGVAVSDGTRTLASPWRTLERTGDSAVDRDAIAAVVEELAATRVVVGMPISLDGRWGRAARTAAAEARALAQALAPRGVPVETFDERLTTVTADRALAEAGRRGPARRRRVDQAAAAVMLQGWLDAHRGTAGD
jgi:putative Holliday junction resolvase